MLVKRGEQIGETMKRFQANSSKPRKPSRAVGSFGLVSVCLIGAVSGCGSLPDAKVTYYHAQSKASVKVVRSVICDAKNHPLVASTVTPTVTHAASNLPAHSLELSKLRGTFVDSDVKFELYEDGRLKSVNASTTGQGEAILKAVTTLAGTIAAFAGTATEPDYSVECAFIKEQGGGKPISVTYEGTIDTGKVNDSQPIEPDASSSFYASRLVSAIGEVCAVVTQTGAPSAVPVKYEPSQGDLVLTARQPGWAQVVVSRKIPGGCMPKMPLWEGRVVVAQLGVDYVLPMPRPATFGKESFSVSFTESGALGTVQYGSNTGAAQALGGLNSLLTIAQGETTAQKVAEVKAEADLVLQQQRLLQCLADPKNCK